MEIPRDSESKPEISLMAKVSDSTSMSDSKSNAKLSGSDSNWLWLGIGFEGLDLNRAIGQSDSYPAAS